MNQILNIYKPVGLTPLQLIQELRKKRTEYKDAKIGFAGRLDPLAHGVMLLMIGEETKNRNKYLNLDKEYEFEVLFGVSTDTYDVLGILENKNLKDVPQDLKEKIIKFIKSRLGKQKQTYPPYSSKEVNGKPLYQYAREGKLSEIKIPEKEIEIYSFDLLNITEVPIEKIKEKIFENINSVDGDFRQQEIIEKWKKFFNLNKNKSFTIAKFKINCSSGTYVRSLANELGKELGSSAIALSILRTKVGNFLLTDSIRLHN